MRLHSQKHRLERVEEGCKRDAGVCGVQNVLSFWYIKPVALVFDGDDEMNVISVNQVLSVRYYLFHLASIFSSSNILSSILSLSHLYVLRYTIILL